MLLVLVFLKKINKIRYTFDLIEQNVVSILLDLSSI